MIFGGLVFQPVDANFIAEHSPDDLRLRFYFDNFITQNIYRERQEIVVLSNVLADPVNAYASDFRYDIVDKINGQKIQRIDDVDEAFKKPADYYVIDMVGKGRPLVLERKAVEEARDRIRDALSSYSGREPSRMKVSAVFLFLVLATAALRAEAAPVSREPAATVLPVSSDSLVRVNSTNQAFDFFRPWTKEGALFAARTGCGPAGWPGSRHSGARG